MPAQARQGEEEDRPLAFLAFGADRAAVTLDDALDRGQPDAVTGKLPFVVQSLERPEKLVDVLLREARTVVLDEEFGHGFRLPGHAEFDPRVGALAGEFPRIAQ